MNSGISVEQSSALETKKRMCSSQQMGLLFNKKKEFNERHDRKLEDQAKSRPRKDPLPVLRSQRSSVLLARIISLHQVVTIVP